MRLMTEREAENFLGKRGFNLVDTYFCKNKKNLLKLYDKVGFPFVMKVSGRKIIHKKKLGGVKIGIKSEEQAVKIFNNMKKIKGFEGVLLQRQLIGKEFILGIKDTPEFGHVIAFGIGGSDVEKLKKVSFRALPLSEDEIKDFVWEFVSKDFYFIKNEIKKLCRVSKDFPNISELDINPLIINKNGAFVVDARIVFSQK